VKGINSVKRTILIAVLAWLYVPAFQATAEEPRPRFVGNCKTGPVTKTYGQTQWLVYSCDDGMTLVFVAAPDSPAMPFYFVLSPTDAGYHLFGEGTGKKEATAAALEQIKTLSASARDIANLILETRAKNSN
jgi:hypothetical protein